MVCLPVFFHGCQDQFLLGYALIWSILHGEIPASILCSKNSIFVQSLFWCCLQHPSCIHSSCSNSRLIFSKYILNFLFCPPLKYSCYCLLLFVWRADFVMVKTFCCFWLQYSVVQEYYWLLPYLCDTHLQIEYTGFGNGYTKKKV